VVPSWRAKAEGAAREAAARESQAHAAPHATPSTASGRVVQPAPPLYARPPVEGELPELLLGEEVDFASRATLGDLDSPLTQELDLRTVGAIAAQRARRAAAASHTPPATPGRAGASTDEIGAEGLGDTDTAVGVAGAGEDLDADAVVDSASLGKHTSLMAAGTAASRLLGFVRNIVLVAAIGASGDVANAFDVANKLPNILFTILAGGVLNAVLVPQIVRAYQSRNPQERLDKLLTLSGTLLLVVTAILTLASSLVIGIYAKDWSPAQLNLGIAFAFWCIPQLFFYGIYTLLGQVLNARNQFGPFMWAPVLNNPGLPRHLRVVHQGWPDGRRVHLGRPADRPARGDSNARGRRAGVHPARPPVPQRVPLPAAIRDARDRAPLVRARRRLDDPRGRARAGRHRLRDALRHVGIGRCGGPG
jgi:hypothetical protein